MSAPAIKAFRISAGLPVPWNALNLSSDYVSEKKFLISLNACSLFNKSVPYTIKPYTSSAILADPSSFSPNTSFTNVLMSNVSRPPSSPRVTPVSRMGWWVAASWSSLNILASYLELLAAALSALFLFFLPLWLVICSVGATTKSGPISFAN